MTRTSTPSSLPFAFAPSSTAAQKGLPAPGPFMSTRTVSAFAAAAVNSAAPNMAPLRRILFITVLPFKDVSVAFHSPPGAGDLRPNGSPNSRAHGGPAAQHIHINGGDDYHTNENLLPKNAHIEKIEAVAEKADDQHAGKHAEHGAAAAEEAGTADDDCGDRIELGTDAGVGKTGIGTPREQKPGEAGKESADHIDDDEHAIDVDAAHPCGLGVAANGVDMAADRGAIEKEPEADGADGNQKQTCRYAGGRREYSEVIGLLAEVADFRLETANRGAARDKIGQAAGNVERSKGHDERMRQPEPGQPGTIHPARGDADERADQQNGLPGISCPVGNGERHHGEGHYRSDREVDAGGEDHDEHAKR